MSQFSLSELTQADLVKLLKLARASNLRPSREHLPANADDRLHSSFAQQRLWFLSQMKGTCESYHLSGGLDLIGDLDREALREAFDRILAHHEALRTTFVLAEGELVRQIIPSEMSNFLLLEEDLREEQDTDRELKRLMILEANASFDLEQGPLIRGRLIQRAENRYTLLITMHRIVSDGLPFGMLVKELSALYSFCRDGQADPLPELDIQYADYFVRRRKLLEVGFSQQQADYWRTKLDTAPTLLEIPTDHPRRGQQSHTRASAEFVLDAELTAGLKSLGGRYGKTLYIMLLAAWVALLARLSGQYDLVIGTPTVDQENIGTEDLIGFAANTLVLRLDLSEPLVLRELLEKVKNEVLAAQQHQDIPFDHVLASRRTQRSLAPSPLFQVMFVWENVRISSLAVSGLQLIPIQTLPFIGVPKVDLLLSLRETKGSINGVLEYATSLFEPSTINRYLGYFRNLLAGMLLDDTISINHISLLSTSERHQLLYEWNDTRTEYPKDLCIHELFEEQVKNTPDAVAVVYEDDELRYAELDRRSNQLAHYLRELGVTPDARVALCIERGFEMIVGLLAVLKAGGAYVPLDSSYPIDRLRFMLEDSSPILILTQKHLQESFTRLGWILPILDIEDTTLWRNHPEISPSLNSIGLTPRHLAYIFYTSGSTGTPKGVMGEHRGVVNLLAWLQKKLGLDEHEAVLQLTPFSFDVSICEFFLPLFTGARLVIARPDGHKDLAYLHQTMCRNGVTTVFFVPSTLQHYLDHETNDQCSTLVRALCGGEILLGTLVRQFQEKLPNATLHNWYGPTEASVATTEWKCLRSVARGNPPIGRPIANTQIYILDGHMEPVPINVVGEIYIGGVGVARGYVNRQELTSERFLVDSFSLETGARMYKTGDLGRWLPDGVVEFLGRNDFQVKVGGYRIELGEIESKLREHRAVREAVIVAPENELGEKHLVAYYTEAESAYGLDAAELQAHLSAELPEYMVPKAYIRLETLPLTTHGKLDRRALPAAEREAYSTGLYEVPEGEIEPVLAVIWADLLKVNQVGRCDDFFELGGHFLLATQLILRVKEKMKIRIALSDVLAFSRLNSLAERIIYLELERFDKDELFQISRLIDMPS